MAISTYAELQAAAAGWLVRGDLTARIPEFIARSCRLSKRRVNGHGPPAASRPPGLWTARL
jgi:hypothetical protein